MHFEHAIADMRAKLRALEDQRAIAEVCGLALNAPLFLTIPAPTVTDEDLERLLAQESN